MNRYIQLFATVILVQIAIASKGSNSLLPRLLQVNKEWLKHNDVVNELKATTLTGNESHTDLIGIHLRIVESSLRKNSPKYLTIEQASNRAYLLDKLHQYWQQGNFPINNYLPFTNPVFIDSYDTHCAVGYLMQQSGYEDLALAINDKERFAFIKEIKTKGVTEWANKNGFTIDELAWIQPGYPPTTRFEELGSGTNGPVNKIVADEGRNTLILAGRFDTLNNLPCLNIGQYKNDQLSCLGTGLKGVVNKLFVNEAGTITAAGRFVKNNDYYQIAIYNDTAWTYIDIPNRKTSIVSAIYPRIYANPYVTFDIEVAITDSTFPNVTEIWGRNHTTHYWQKRATVNGCIQDVAVNQFYKSYVGRFDSITIHSDTANQTIYSTNVINSNDYVDSAWLVQDAPLSDTINRMLRLGNTYYYAGSNGLACLWRQTPIEKQTLVSTSNNYRAVKDMFFIDDELYVCGEFGTLNTNGHYGNNIGYYDSYLNYIKVMGNFNGVINSIAKLNGKIYVGGEFTNNGPMRPMKYIARIKDTNTAISEPDNTIDFKIYPNPSSDYINLEIPNTNIDKVELVDMSGRVMLEQTSSFTTIAIDKLSQGIYFVRVHSNEGIGTTKFIKN